MKIIHLSDLHFGTQTDFITHLLQDTIHELKPDLVVVSGDFTQIAATSEFTVAKRFMDKLSVPTLCVPGNHDIPPWNPIERLFNPYRKYKKYITPDFYPVYKNPHIIVAGINSARRALPHWNWANGAISAEQLHYLQTIFPPDEPRWTVCTFHHPIHKVDDMPLDVTVFGGKKALDQICRQRIDLVLTGHVHHASIITRGDDVHQTVYLSASTALSSRTRGQENGFNVISFDRDKMNIRIFKLQEDAFRITQSFKQYKNR